MLASPTLARKEQPTFPSSSSSAPHSERCSNPISFICGVGSVGGGCPFLLFESPLLLPFVLLSFPGRREGGREGGTVVSNELATVHFTPTVKICGGIGRRRGRRERVTAVRSSYPVICRSTRASSPPTNSGATEYLVRWHARRQGGKEGFASEDGGDDDGRRSESVGFFRPSSLSFSSALRERRRRRRSAEAPY